MSETLKLEVIGDKYKLSKKTNNTWNFMILSEVELKNILKLIEEKSKWEVDIVQTVLSKNDRMADGIYSTVALNGNDVFARSLEDSSIKDGVAISECNWHEFAQDSFWEIWEDDRTLYYHGEVVSLVAHRNIGYVKFKVLGEPKSKYQG